MMVSDKKESGVQAVAAGLLCTVGRDVFCRDNGRDAWQIVLKDKSEAFDLDPLARPQASPDGQHSAFVAVSGVERHVSIVALPGPVVRTLASAFTHVYGMAWSPAAKQLCIVAEDPSVGVLSMDGSQAQSTLPVFSLFMAGNDDPDVTPVTGPIALPGVPRWSPAGDAVAVVGLERGDAQVALVVTTDGREGPLVSGERVMLGTVPWTASGSLLCAVSEHGDGIHIQLVDTATGASTEQGEPWEDVCWLSFVGNRVLVAGKSDSTWVVADVTDGARTVLTASFVRIVDVAATPEHLWIVAPVESGDLGLWSIDLCGEHLRLHIVAPSICGLQMRVDGRTVAVMAGPAGAETVQVTTIDDEEVLDMGRRDMIMGWMEEHMPQGRLPHLHYLLAPTFQVVDEWVAPFAPGNVKTGRLEVVDAPKPLTPSTPLVPVEAGTPESGVSDDAQVQTVSVDDQSVRVLSLQSDQPAQGKLRRLRLVAVVTAVVVVAIAATVIAVQHGKRAGIAANESPTVTTPSTPSVSLPGNDAVSTPSAVTVTPKVPPATSPVVVKPATTTPPVIVTYGVKTGLWVVATDLLRVRSGAGTDTSVLGYLLVTERARVLSGPTLIETTPWWYVRCYDADGKAGLTGWVSGEYVRPSSAPVVVTPTPSPAVKPTTGIVVLTSVPPGAHVVVNGTDKGVTPVSLTLPGKEVTITLSLSGYMDYTATLTVEVGTTVHLTYPLLSLGTAGN